MKRTWYTCVLAVLMASCGCKKDSDCGEGRFCLIGVNADGEQAGVCKDTTEVSEAERARAAEAGWRLKSVSIQAGPVGVALERK